MIQIWTNKKRKNQRPSIQNKEVASKWNQMASSWEQMASSVGEIGQQMRPGTSTTGRWNDRTGQNGQ